MDDNSGGPSGGLERFVIKEVAGRRFGILGVLREETGQELGEASGIRFESSVGTATEVAARRELGADVVIALTHLDLSRDKELASTKSVDLIIGGHDHELLSSWVDGVPIFEAGQNAHFLGRGSAPSTGR